VLKPFKNTTLILSNTNALEVKINALFECTISFGTTVNVKGIVQIENSDIIYSTSLNRYHEEYFNCP